LTEKGGKIKVGSKWIPMKRPPKHKMEIQEWERRGAGPQASARREKKSKKTKPQSSKKRIGGNNRGTGN